MASVGGCDPCTASCWPQPSQGLMSQALRDVTGCQTNFGWRAKGGGAQSEPEAKRGQICRLSTCTATLMVLLGGGNNVVSMSAIKVKLLLSHLVELHL